MNLQVLSFKGVQFRSNNYSEYKNEITNLNFSFILTLPLLMKLTLSYSNFIEVITDEEMAAFCEKLKSLESFEYLGFARICKTITNSRKYDKLL
jgi:hypothetical protein